jgi:hypothetical protein
MIHLNGVEALWIGVNFLTLILTTLALFDALHDLKVVAGADRRRARTLTARGNVRREVMRLAVQALLLSVAIPGAFREGEIDLTPPLMALIAVPVFLLISTLLDTRDRSRLAGMLLTDIAAERAETALETSVQENIELTHKAIEHAEAAYHEANTVNEKIARLTEIVGGKEDKPQGAT